MVRDFLIYLLMNSKLSKKKNPETYLDVLKSLLHILEFFSLLNLRLTISIAVIVHTVKPILL